jgi:hypothetical protein
VPKKHEGLEERAHTFDHVWEWLNSAGPQELTTRAGTTFVAKAAITTKGKRSGERVIRYFQNEQEYGRCYECCWKHYYNCNRTRIGMYSQSLDGHDEREDSDDGSDYWHMYSVLLRYWSVQNSILQACRAAFFVVSTFTLGFATDMLFSQQAHEGVLLSGLAVIPLAILWRRICEDRGHNDSYFRWQLLKLEAGQNPGDQVLSAFREFQQEPPETKYYILSTDTIGRMLLESRTRQVLDFWLPCAYLAWWFVLAALSVCELYPRYAGGM